MEIRFENQKRDGAFGYQESVSCPRPIFFAFEKNRYRQGDILQSQCEPHVGKQQIYDGEKDIQFEPKQGVSVNLDRHQPKYTYRLLVEFTLVAYR